MADDASTTIRTGIGGWTYAPWRETFYPPGTSSAKELAYASRQLATIEINGTFYRTQTPATFRKWAEATPNGFVFSVKAPRYTTHRRDLAEAGTSVEAFLDSGVTELKEKLGPILWQFPPTWKFDKETMAGFLTLLPRERNGRTLQHVLEVRHPSFVDAEFILLLRRHDASVVLADSDDYPLIADLAGPCIYARLQRSRSEIGTGYDMDALAAWASRFRQMTRGTLPKDLPRLAPDETPARQRPAFVYLISGAKERAPAGAMALANILAA